jgi:hypothetical protein
MHKLLLVLFYSWTLSVSDILSQIKSALSADEQREKFLLTKIDKLDKNSMLFTKKSVGFSN